MPSVQLATYLQARADGSTVEQACAVSTIGLREAELHEADIASGELELPRARAPAHARTRETETWAETQTDQECLTEKEPFMARDNEGERETVTSDGVSVAADELRLLIERVEWLQEEIDGINDDKKDVFAEAKSRGFDTATMKRIIRLRKMEPHHRQEAAALLETYANAVGLQDALPL